MLYKIEKSGDVFEKIEPVEFKDFTSFGKLEKDLENLIAKNILDVLFEEAKLMPIFQERQWQSEADIYALNEKGDLVIFELKRATAGHDAVQQALRYAQDSSQWTFQKLQNKYQEYTKSNQSLENAHSEAFSLEHKLTPKEFNLKQHLVIIGSAADDSLITAVDYWKNCGVSIEFLPYRVYELGGEKYLEFFSPPYDKHRNPSDVKGVLFDTNRSWDEESIWSMMEKGRLEAYGDAKRFVTHVNVGDIVFYSHKGYGIVAAARVKGEVKAPDNETLYRDVEFLTPRASKDTPLKYMSFAKVAEFTGKSFFWARTIKVPYLSKSETFELLNELKKYL